MIWSFVGRRNERICRNIYSVVITLGMVLALWRSNFLLIITRRECWLLGECGVGLPGGVASVRV